MTIEHEARAEAFKRYDGDRIIDENTGVEVSHDDWGFADTARQAFVAGAEWAAGRLSVPPSDDEREALRDELAGWVIGAGYYQSMVGTSDAAEMADAILAAGFRRQGPITVVTTVPAMDALPPRTVVMDGGGEVWRKCSNGRWDCLDENGDEPTEEARTVLWQSMNGPSATVLWKPVGAAERARSAVPSTTEQES